MTAVFLTSQSVSSSFCASFLHSLFGITDSGDDNNRVEDGVTTDAVTKALGKKISNDNDGRDIPAL